MNAEKPHIDSGRGPSDLQQRLDGIATLATLEREGHHADKLLKKLDPTRRNRIARAVEKLHGELLAKKNTGFQTSLADETAEMHEVETKDHRPHETINTLRAEARRTLSAGLRHARQRAAQSLPEITVFTINDPRVNEVRKKASGVVQKIRTGIKRH